MSIRNDIAFANLAPVIEVTVDLNKSDLTNLSEAEAIEVSRRQIDRLILERSRFSCLDLYGCRVFGDPD
jgi:hypothetical protein